jgi:hypothetical protein
MLAKNLGMYRSYVFFTGACHIFRKNNLGTNNTGKKLNLKDKKDNNKKDNTKICSKK